MARSAAMTQSGDTRTPCVPGSPRSSPARDRRRALNYAHTIVVAVALAATSMRAAETDTLVALVDPAHQGNDARRVVVAQPPLTAKIDDWRLAGQEILKLTNAARAQPRSCGKRRFRPAPPLKWNEKLAAAALVHSRDMAARNYFSHTGKDGRSVGDRASGESYSWRHIGENIAKGQGSPEQIVATWLASPEHCTNIMYPAFTEMGAAHVVSPKSATLVYSTQVFGTTRR